MYSLIFAEMDMESALAASFIKAFSALVMRTVQ